MSGVKFEGWSEAARKARRWVRRAEDGAKAFILKGHDAESIRRAARRGMIATTTPTVHTEARAGGGDVLPKPNGVWVWPSSS